MEKKQVPSVQISSCIATILVLCTGCSITQQLIEQFTVVDPPIVSITSGYYLKDEIIIEYIVGPDANSNANGNKSSFQKQWAQFSLQAKEDGDGNTVDRYQIHPGELDRQNIAGWKSIKVVNLATVLSPGANGCYNPVEYQDYGRTIADSELPTLVVLSEETRSGHTTCYSAYFAVIYIDQRSGDRIVYAREPRGKHIPLKNIPSLVVRFPFAVLLDFANVMGSSGLP